MLTFAILFALDEIYYMFNVSRLTLSTKRRFLDLVHYICQVGSIIWVIWGLTMCVNGLLWIIPFIWIMRFISFHLGRKTHILYGLIRPVITLLVYLSVYFIH